MVRKEMYIHRYSDIPRLMFKPAEGVDFEEVNLRIPAINNDSELMSFEYLVENCIKRSCGSDGCIGEGVITIDEETANFTLTRVSRAAILCFRDDCPLGNDSGPGGYSDDREPRSPIPLSPSVRTTAEESIV